MAIPQIGEIQDDSPTASPPSTLVNASTASTTTPALPRHHRHQIPIHSRLPCLHVPVEIYSHMHETRDESRDMQVDEWRQLGYETEYPNGGNWEFSV